MCVWGGRNKASWHFMAHRCIRRAHIAIFLSDDANAVAVGAKSISTELCAALDFVLQCDQSSVGTRAETHVVAQLARQHARKSGFSKVRAAPVAR